MILVNTEDAEEKAKKILYWATQARESARHYQHTEIGYNYRMSNIVAGIGRGQLKVLNQRIEQKRAIYSYYKEAFKDMKDIKMMPLSDDERSNCWLSSIQLKSDSKVKPLDIMLALEENDIESRPIWKPMHLQPVFQDCDFITTAENITISDKEIGADTSYSGQLFEHGVCLPSDTKMTDADLERIVTIIKGLWK